MSDDAKAMAQETLSRIKQSVVYKANDLSDGRNDLAGLLTYFRELSASLGPAAVLIDDKLDRDGYYECFVEMNKGDRQAGFAIKRAIAIGYGGAYFFYCTYSGFDHVLPGKEGLEKAALPALMTELKEATEGFFMR